MKSLKSGERDASIRIFTAPYDAPGEVALAISGAHSCSVNGSVPLTGGLADPGEGVQESRAQEDDRSDELAELLVLVGHLAVGTYQIQPIWQCAIGTGDLIVDFIDHDRHANFQAECTSLRDLNPFLVGGGIVDQYFLITILVHDPTFLWMCLAYVDHHKLDVTSPLFP